MNRVLGVDLLNVTQLRSLVEQALAEDIGEKDITTERVVKVDKRVTAEMIAKQSGLIAGLPVAALVFSLVGEGIHWMPLIREGGEVVAGSLVAQVVGSARLILTAERVALNFLTHLSGIATLTAQFVGAVAGTQAKIYDTRKTLPGLRSLQKYAVRIGGGENHRAGLTDGILVKDNHIAVVGGISTAIQLAQAGDPHRILPIEVEVRSLPEVEEALLAGADLLLLDNMSLEMLTQAVALVRQWNERMPEKKVLTEASGGVHLENVRSIALTGVDRISVGGLTHSVPALDLSLKIRKEEKA